MLLSVFVIGSSAHISPVALSSTLASLGGMEHCTDCLTPGGSISNAEFLYLLTCNHRDARLTARIGCHCTLLSCVA